MAFPDGVRIRFDHVSLAVNSIDGASSFFQRFLPIQPRNEKTLSEQVSGSFYWKDFFLGGFPVELIEDLPGEEGFITRFIQKHGGGFHHIAFEMDDIAPVVERLKADGVRVVDELDFGDGNATVFISPRAAFGTLIQLWRVADYDAPRVKPIEDGLARFDHIAIAVNDIDRALDFFQRYFPAHIVRQKHLSRSSGNFILAQVEIAGGRLEFIQSPGYPADDFVAAFIERYGEGMHHMAVDVKEFDATLAKLRQEGVRVVSEGRDRHGRRYFFISPRSAFGALIQVWEGV